MNQITPSLVKPYLLAISNILARNRSGTKVLWNLKWKLLIDRKIHLVFEYCHYLLKGSTRRSQNHNLLFHFFLSCDSSIFLENADCTSLLEWSKLSTLMICCILSKALLVVNIECSQDMISIFRYLWTSSKKKNN